MTQNPINHQRSSLRLSEGAWVIAGKVVSFMMMLIMVRLLTGFLDTREYGKLVLGLTLCNLMTQLVMGALGQGIGRYYSMVLCEGGWDAFLKAVVRLLERAGWIIGILGGLSIIVFFLMDHAEYAFFVLVLCIFSYLAGLNDIASGLHNLARNRMVSTRNTAAELFIRLPIVGGILFFWGESANLVVLGYLLSGLIMLMVQKLDIAKLKPLSVKSDQLQIDWQSKILKIALPASFWGIFVWLQQASDRWWLQAFSSTHDVAQYAVIYQIGYVPIIAGMGVLSTLFTPILYQKEESNKKLITRLLFFIFGITCLGVAGTWLCGDLIMNILTSAQYREAAKFLPHMVLAAGMYSAGDILSIKMMSDIRVKTIMAIKIIVSLLALIINAFGAYYYGIAGVVYASIAFGFVFLVLFVLASLIFNYREKVIHV